MTPSILCYVPLSVKILGPTIPQFSNQISANLRVYVPRGRLCEAYTSDQKSMISIRQYRAYVHVLLELILQVILLSEQAICSLSMIARPTFIAFSHSLATI